MDKLIQITEEEIQNVKKINSEYKNLTGEVSTILIEKLKLQERITNLDNREKEVINSLKLLIKLEESFLIEITNKYGEIKTINIEKGEICLK